MRASLDTIFRGRWWGIPPLLLLIWHGHYTVTHLGVDYLFFVCYTAHLLLGLGLLLGSGLLAGTGFGWMIIAFPLWLYRAVLLSDWQISCALFHIVGLLIGIVTVPRLRLPKHTWLFAMLVALILQGLARLFTDEALNINAAFRVYQGWEGIFPDYRVYFLTMLLGFSSFFALFTMINNHFHAKVSKHAGD